MTDPIEYEPYLYGFYARRADETPPASRVGLPLLEPGETTLYALEGGVGHVFSDGPAQEKP